MPKNQSNKSSSSNNDQEMISPVEESFDTNNSHESLVSDQTDQTQNLQQQLSVPSPPSVQPSAPIQWPPMQWIPVPGPWAVGPNQQQWAPYSPSGEGTNHGPRIDGSGHRSESSSTGHGMNPYLGLQPGFYPYPILGAGHRPEPGDVLYTSPADGPELRIINPQLTGPNNYNAWARDFRRALVTKDKDGFLDGTVPVPDDDHMRQRCWRRCNQLVRTWIGNCVAADVITAGLPPTEDSKQMWDDIREMYGKLERAKLFSLTQALSDLKQGNQSVTACFNRLSSLWNELEAAEVELKGPKETLEQYRRIREREKVTRFLLILNEGFSRTSSMSLDFC